MPLSPGVKRLIVSKIAYRIWCFVAANWSYDALTQGGRCGVLEEVPRFMSLLSGIVGIWTARYQNVDLVPDQVSVQRQAEEPKNSLLSLPFPPNISTQ